MSPFFPLLAAAIAALFSYQLGRQYAARRRDHALAWSISLALFSLGHLAVLVGVTAGWSAWVFAVYWLSGALLNVPFLAVGELLLLDRDRRVLWWTLAGLATAWSVVFVAVASYDTAALAAEQAVPAGREIIPGTTAYALLRPMTTTFVIVVVGSLWSAIRGRRWSVALIALGVTVAAAGSSVIDTPTVWLFPVLSALGVGMMYVGFRAASAQAVGRRVSAETGSR